jgi:hypothetical protein
MKTIYTYLGLLTITLVSCGNPNEWNDERKQIVKDKCDSELFDCDCFIKSTIEYFPNAQDYNKTLENESKNQEKVDAYWDNLYENCMKD